ncbi:hypothetical protein RUND412_007809 [Rhizina undulata]
MYIPVKTAVSVLLLGYATAAHTLALPAVAAGDIDKRAFRCTMGRDDPETCGLARLSKGLPTTGVPAEQSAGV